MAQGFNCETPILWKQANSTNGLSTTFITELNQWWLMVIPLGLERSLLVSPRAAFSALLFFCFLLMTSWMAFNHRFNFLQMTQLSMPPTAKQPTCNFHFHFSSWPEPLVRLVCEMVYPIQHSKVRTFRNLKLTKVTSTDSATFRRLPAPSSQNDKNFGCYLWRQTHLWRTHSQHQKACLTRTRHDSASLLLSSNAHQGNSLQVLCTPDSGVCFPLLAVLGQNSSRLPWQHSAKSVLSFQNQRPALSKVEVATSQS